MNMKSFLIGSAAALACVALGSIAQASQNLPIPDSPRDIIFYGPQVAALPLGGLFITNGDEIGASKQAMAPVDTKLGPQLATKIIGNGSEASMATAPKYGPQLAQFGYPDGNGMKKPDGDGMKTPLGQPDFGGPKASPQFVEDTDHDAPPTISFAILPWSTETSTEELSI